MGDKHGMHSCLIHRPNGYTYNGELKNGFQEGPGVLINPVGLQKPGIWLAGNWKSWTKPELSEEDASKLLKVKNDPKFEVYVNEFTENNPEAVVIYIYIYIRNYWKSVKKDLIMNPII